MKLGDLNEKLGAISEEIVKLFPIGSEWYDSQQDSMGKVVMHFAPRGIILDGGLGPGLTRIPVGHLVDGRLLPDEATADECHDAFFGRVKKDEGEDERYRTALKENGLDGATVWE